MNTTLDKRITAAVALAGFSLTVLNLILIEEFLSLINAETVSTRLWFGTYVAFVASMLSVMVCLLDDKLNVTYPSACSVSKYSVADCPREGLGHQPDSRTYGA